MDITLRAAAPDDAAALAALARANRHLLVDDVDDPAAARFLALLEVPAMAERLASAEYATSVADADGVPVGYVTMKGAHLYHLFVAPAHHRTGIARRLWAHAREQVDAPAVTVNASLYAEPFYRHVGFERTAAPSTGVPPYVPMRWQRG